MNKPQLQLFDERAYADPIGEFVPLPPSNATSLLHLASMRDNTGGSPSHPTGTLATGQVDNSPRNSPRRASSSSCLSTSGQENQHMRSNMLRSARTSWQLPGMPISPCCDDIRPEGERNSMLQHGSLEDKGTERADMEESEESSSGGESDGSDRSSRRRGTKRKRSSPMGTEDQREPGSDDSESSSDSEISTGELSSSSGDDGDDGEEDYYYNGSNWPGEDEFSESSATDSSDDEAPGSTTQVQTDELSGYYPRRYVFRTSPRRSTTSSPRSRGQYSSARQIWSSKYPCWYPSYNNKQ